MACFLYFTRGFFLQAAPLISMLLKSDNASATFCSIADLTQYVVYDNATDLSKIQDIICAWAANVSLIVGPDLQEYRSLVGGG